jgi:hypothetical protein
MAVIKNQIFALAVFLAGLFFVVMVGMCFAIFYIVVVVGNVYDSRPAVSAIASPIDEARAPLAMHTSIHIEPKENLYDMQEANSSPRRYSDEEADMLARTVWGEAGGLPQEEQALVIWTVLQRVDAGFGDTISAVVTSPNQFAGHDTSHPIKDEILELVQNELGKWELGCLPPTHERYCPSPPYYFFNGMVDPVYGGLHNFFREKY